MDFTLAVVGKMDHLSYLSLKQNGQLITEQLPEENRVVIVSNVAEVSSIEKVMDIAKYSKYLKLIQVTARLIAVFRCMPKPSLGNILKFPADYISEAENIWIIEA